MPLASFTIAAFPAWVLGLVYVPLTGLAVYQYRRSTKAGFQERGNFPADKIS
jgi:hypothetical protein